jgi:hypothetical protein
VPWEERLEIVNTFTDRRLKKIEQRLIYLQRPDLLPARRADYDRAIAARIGRPDAGSPWLTQHGALGEIDKLMTEANADEMVFLQAHREHILSRMEPGILR